MLLQAAPAPASRLISSTAERTQARRHQTLVDWALADSGTRDKNCTTTYPHPSGLHLGCSRNPGDWAVGFKHLFLIVLRLWVFARNSECRLSTLNGFKAWGLRVL